MTLIVPFPGSGQTTVAEVGGKGMSLVRMVEAGLPVPPGAVLTTMFFAPWFDELKTTTAWSDLAGAPPDDWASYCDELKDLGSRLPLTADQGQALAELQRVLGPPAENALFAVRSSSPEEDLASASFAGGYETRLGVRRDGLEEAVRHAFASSLDARVLAYKQAHGFDVLGPRIAVVVQQQIDSEVSGVGFSLNPMTNDYDEAVIDASWGLGESVVAGLVSPDHFVVDKVDGRIVDRQLGDKVRSVWLSPDGGTVERADHRSSELTLSDDRVGELTDVLVRVETLFGGPTDIEWAYSDGGLHVLQARPITTYVPLPPAMLTRPGERRRLYMDAALSKGLAISTPVSPMGLDWLEDIYVTLIEHFAGPTKRDITPEEALWFFEGGRMYLNASNMLWLTSPEKWAKSTTQTDVLMAEIAANIDSEQYRAPTRPSWARLRMLRYAPRVIWRLRHFLWRAMRALASPRNAHEQYRREVDIFESEMTHDVDFSLPFDEFRQTYAIKLLHTFDVSMSALMAGVAALSAVDRVAGKSTADDDLAERLKMGLPGNVVVEMGIGLHGLARQLDRAAYDDLDLLAQRVGQREMDQTFLNEWDSFMSQFGSRGPREMDLAIARYADDPLLALQQMSVIVGIDEEHGPEAAHRRHVRARREAYEQLMSRSGPLRRALLRRVNLIIELFAGSRDTPKRETVMYNYAVRRRALIEGRRLVEEGRLDAPEHVFDLTYGDMTAASHDPALDLREARAERRVFLDVLSAQVKGLPHVIDSRGRILRPAPREETPGELKGMAASPGVVTGPVKLLHDPHAKRIEEGDVLVAYTTDPGWTPLFVTAAAVVLQVGGILQHGAVVAREYGKPCVVGIDRLTTQVHDGQMVEVDGSAGTVRLLS